MTQPTFNQLPAEVQTDLLEWFNIVPASVDDEDKARLAALYNAGRFHAWDCPNCGERVYFGAPDENDPELSWANFQGVLQADYTSYPGDEASQTVTQRIVLCDHCRMQWPPVNANALALDYAKLTGKENIAPWRTHQDIPTPDEL